jgi:hypothetical protein
VEPARPRLPRERRQRGGAPGPARPLSRPADPRLPHEDAATSPIESADDVRASLAVARLADLDRHEATSPEGESRVADLLRAARVLSWPLVVDGESGIILDGSHRAVVLAREFGARFAVVQRVALDAPDIRLASWCRVLEGVSPAAFDAARRTLGLEADCREGLRCHYGDRVYGRSGSSVSGSHELAGEIERRLAPNGSSGEARLVEDEAVAEWIGAAGVVVLRPPPLDKTTVRRRPGGALLPLKSTRFLFPYRVLGLAVPLAALGGSREALEAEVERERARPLACLGAGLAVDRRYPERLWQFVDHRIPDRLFADEAGRHAYADALARAAVPAQSRPGRSRPGCQSDRQADCQAD